MKMTLKEFMNLMAFLSGHFDMGKSWQCVECGDDFFGPELTVEDMLEHLQTHGVVP